MKCLILAATLAASATVAAGEVKPSKAANYAGQYATVCGKAVEVTTRSGDTFINLDKKHPRQDFYFYYYGNDIPRSKILSKKVCGSGVIATHKGKSQIIIENPNDLFLK